MPTGSRFIKRMVRARRGGPYPEDFWVKLNCGLFAKPRVWEKYKTWPLGPLEPKPFVYRYEMGRSPEQAVMRHVFNRLPYLRFQKTQRDDYPLAQRFALYQWDLMSRNKLSAGDAFKQATKRYEKELELVERQVRTDPSSAVRTQLAYHDAWVRKNKRDDPEYDDSKKSAMDMVDEAFPSRPFWDRDPLPRLRHRRNMRPWRIQQYPFEPLQPAVTLSRVEPENVTDVMPRTDGKKEGDFESEESKRAAAADAARAVSDAEREAVAAAEAKFNADTAARAAALAAQSDDEKRMRLALRLTGGRSHTLPKLVLAKKKIAADTTTATAAPEGKEELVQALVELELARYEKQLEESLSEEDRAELAEADRIAREADERDAAGVAFVTLPGATAPDGSTAPKKFDINSQEVNDPNAKQVAPVKPWWHDEDHQ